MDGGTFSPVNHYFMGEIVAASATATACAAWVASCIRQQTVRRRSRTNQHSAAGELLRTVGPKLLLAGDYRGRAVKMTTTGDWLTVTVQAVNLSRVFAEFSSADPIRLPWISSLCRRRLEVVADKWSVAVRGRTIMLSCQAVDEPERLRFALDVACDLADAVDQAETSLPR